MKKSGLQRLTECLLQRFRAGGVGSRERDGDGDGQQRVGGPWGVECRCGAGCVGRACACPSAPDLDDLLPHLAPGWAATWPDPRAVETRRWLQRGKCSAPSWARSPRAPYENLGHGNPSARMRVPGRVWGAGLAAWFLLRPASHRNAPADASLLAPQRRRASWLPSGFGCVVVSGSPAPSPDVRRVCDGTFLLELR